MASVKNPFYNEKTKKVEFEFEPVGDRIFVYPIPNPEKIGSIIITEEVDLMDGREMGIVIAANEKWQVRGTGVEIKSELNIGDVVTYVKGVASKSIPCKAVNGDFVLVKTLYYADIFAKVKNG